MTPDSLTKVIAEWPHDRVFVGNFDTLMTSPDPPQESDYKCLLNCRTCEIIRWRDAWVAKAASDPSLTFDSVYFSFVRDILGVKE